MMEITGATLDKQATQIDCRHHWVIDTPSGPTSRGVCKVCGAEKEFQNYQFDFFWEDDLLSRASPGPSGNIAEADEEAAEAA